jgi:NAD-specific glutamate dehydrogenase
MAMEEAVTEQKAVLGLLASLETLPVTRIFTELSMLDQVSSIQALYRGRLLLAQALDACARWYIRNLGEKLESAFVDSSEAALIPYYTGFVDPLLANLPSLEIISLHSPLLTKTASLATMGMPQPLAQSLAACLLIEPCLEVTSVSLATSMGTSITLPIYLTVTEQLALGAINGYNTTDGSQNAWDRKASLQLMTAINKSVRELTQIIVNKHYVRSNDNDLTYGAPSINLSNEVSSFLQSRPRELSRYKQLVQQLEPGSPAPCAALFLIANALDALVSVLGKPS